MAQNGDRDANKPSPTVDFVSGVIAGAAGLVVGQPLDVVKVRYQTPQYAGRYNSILGAFRDIIKTESVSGLFKGVMSPMAGIAFINGVVFTSYSFLMSLQIVPGSEDEPSLTKICLAGAGSGVVGALLTCPTELIKIRQQSAPPHLNPSVLDVCRSIVRTDGFRGLYRGFSATAMRELAYGPYFCTYEAVCRFFKWMRPSPPPPPSTPNRHGSRHHPESLIDEAERELTSGLTWAELMTAGGCAGVTAWIATFPLDVFKTRMQSAQWPVGQDELGKVSSFPSTFVTSRVQTTGYVSSGTASGNGNGNGNVGLRTNKPVGLLAVARHAVRTEGWRVMFSGLTPTLIRAVPTNMVIFLTFEACVAAMSR